MKKVWVDTDIGDDIDDALALAYLMAATDVEIMGVSTVFENVVKRAKIAKTLLCLGGHGSVPVYAGAGKPRKVNHVFDEPINLEKDPRSYDPAAFEVAEVSQGGAVDALARCLLAYPNEVSVISLGALTNIATLMDLRPNAAAKAKGYFIMGGAVSLNLNEYNFTCDPESTKVVIDSPYPKRVTTLDVTFQCALPESDVRRLRSLSSPLFKTVLAMHELWGGPMILHDPLAAASALGDNCATYEPSNIYIETKGGYSRGKCINLCDFNWRRDKREELLVSSSVDGPEFISRFIKTAEVFDRKLCRPTIQKSIEERSNL